MNFDGLNPNFHQTPNHLDSPWTLFSPLRNTVPKKESLLSLLWKGNSLFQVATLEMLFKPSCFCFWMVVMPLSMADRTPLLGPLRGILHATAWLFQVPKKCHYITLILMELHWLPLPARTIFKTSGIIYKAIGTHTPCLSCRQARHLWWFLTHPH